MNDNQTDQDWEYFGRTDPYWAVVTNESFRRENLDESATEFFFRTGEEYIAHIFDVIHSCVHADFHPERALDFGSGVGRLVVPLASRCSQVVGVDVSESMLKESQRVVRDRKLANISFVKGDDILSAVPGNFDLINSYIVLQHIPTFRGIKIFQRLVGLLREGGVGVLHVTYARSDSCPGKNENVVFPPFRWKGLVPGGIRKVFRGAITELRKIGRGSGGSEKAGKPLENSPMMQMNHYNLNQVFHILQNVGVKTVHLEFTDHSGTCGAIIFFRKTAGAASPGNY